MKFKASLLLLALCSFPSVKAQQPATAGETLQEAVTNLQNKAAASLVQNVPFKNIGPSIMSGRVVDLAVNPKNSAEFYVGYASGGVWHTKNNGTTFTPILDNAATQNVGTIAVDWSSKTIWVGTGENNASRSSYAGIGILKSTDGGKTWVNKGLTDAHHFGPISINPTNTSEVTVAVTGHLYSPNRERGIYKTTDGGETWEKTLFVGDQTGIIDLVRAKDNPRILFATAWQKDRKAWDFDGSGKYSGIYKSSDSGTTWDLISTENSDFPNGEGVGRIGLAAYDSNTIYAVLDNQNHRKPTKNTKKEGLNRANFEDITMDAFMDLDDKTLDAFLRDNNFEDKYDSKSVKNMVKSGTIKPTDLAKYLEDANNALFDTPVIGAEVYRSDNGGISWKKMNEDFIEDVFYSYGYYFAWIRVDPSNKNKIYIGGVPIIKSADAGKTWKSIDAENVHSDHHTLWIDPNLPGHLINGNDGGVNITYDDGATWSKNNAEALGQFYDIAVDNQKPYKVYGGLQDNGVWVGDHTATNDKGWESDGEYPWKSIMGGDGMQVQIDSRNPDIVYTGFQFGNYFRLDREKDTQTYIQPKHQLGESPYRFNWETPILLSPHNQDILYLGANKLLRSFDQGATWEAISEDLTHGAKEGNVAYGTLSNISESPFQFGLIYTGSDDGIIQITQDGGVNWDILSKDLPVDLWVSSVVASQHKKERVYATLNGYRWDDFTPYVFKSDDYGKNWEPIAEGLPLSPVNVIIEDPAKENILYLGTDNGAYISMDAGVTWELFSKNLPPVAVHDLAVQQEEKDLLVATHGRSIYLADIEPFQATTNLSSLQFFEPKEVQFSSRWGSKRTWGKPNIPKTELVFLSPEKGEATITLRSANDKEIKQWRVAAVTGYNYINYDLSIPENGKKTLENGKKELEITKADDTKYYLPAGNYNLTISINGKFSKTKLIIKENSTTNRYSAPDPETED
ncbi:WD40/YVTN/BNR-like repeat-containing protein [Flavimarina sp. Hel_I_48]|uniref:WD40/YVTN/BNR-like repeat-containing protein n=1 Tax=Flavimarina sp. Hel_I_48 TaxID=1392488 RepID=UPI0006913789|nr:sialidase family protein [Flavimarina sp. Hel_I_48]